MQGEECLTERNIVEIGQGRPIESFQSNGSKKSPNEKVYRIILFTSVLTFLIISYILVAAVSMDMAYPSIVTNQVTVIIYTSEPSYPYLKKVVSSFHHKNTYPIAELLIVNDAKHLSPEFIKIVNQYSNITILTTGSESNRTAAIDFVQSSIKSSFILFLEDDEILTEDILSQSIKVLENNPNVRQIRYRGKQLKEEEREKSGKGSNDIQMSSKLMKIKANGILKESVTSKSSKNQNHSLQFADAGFAKQPRNNLIPAKERQSNGEQRRVIPIDPSSNLTVVMITCCSRQKWMKKSIANFLNVNTYPIARFIIVNDNSKINQEFIDVANGFSNLTLLVTGIKVGQLFAIDMAYSLVSTAYVYLMEDDWSTRLDIAAKHIAMLDNDPKLLTIRLTGHRSKREKTLKGYFKKKAGSSMGIGFALSNHIFRMKTYHQLPGGSFSELTEYRSFGTGAGYFQQFIKDYFLTTKYEMTEGEVAIYHSGSDSRNKRINRPLGFKSKYIFNEKQYQKELEKQEREWMIKKQSISENSERE